MKEHPQDCRLTNNQFAGRQNTEQALQESEALYRSFVDNSFDVIFILDATGTFRFVTPSWEQHFGYPGESVIGQPFAPVVHPDDIQPCFEYLEHVLTSGLPGTSPRYRVKCANGSWKLFIANGSRFINAQGEVLFHGIGRDISELDYTLDQLRVSEERYRAIVNAQTEFVDRHLPDGTLTFVNEAICRYAGIPEEELLGRSFYQYVHEEDREKLVTALAALTPANPTVDIINRVVLPDSSLHWHHWTHTAIFDDSGAIMEYQSVGRDITAQKQAEEAKNTYEEALKIALAAACAGTWERDMATDRVTWSRETFSLYGMDPEKGEPTMAEWQSTIHPDDVADVQRRIQEAIEQHHDFVNDYRIILPDGSIRWLSAQGRPSYDQEGRPLRLSGITLNINERKQMEIALRESERKYRRLHETMVDGFVLVDMAGRLLEANEAYRSMLGYDSEELPFLTYQRLTPERWHAFEEGIVRDQVLVRGYSDVYEKEYVRKDGSIFPVELRVFLLTDSGDNETGMWAIVRDITERKMMENALKQAQFTLEARVLERTAALLAANEQIKQISYQLVQAEEQERVRIAGELHDQVGQDLLLAKIKLDMLSSQITAAGKRASVESIAGLLESAIQDIRTLTFGMRPPLLDTAGLEAALEWLITHLFNDYRLQVDFHRDRRSTLIAPEQRYPIYQAVRELLLNVAKHAGIDRAELAIKTEADLLVIKVADCGSGFSRDEQTGGLNASGGFGLFNVQRRIAQLGGEFAIESSALGTVATLTIPLHLS